MYVYILIKNKLLYILYIYVQLYIGNVWVMTYDLNECQAYICML